LVFRHEMGRVDCADLGRVWVLGYVVVVHGCGLPSTSHGLVCWYGWVVVFL
jgi:hypothetical protein